ncbi:MAG: MFS transporter [Planctomycetia bacterium]|nr:MFS transporter [Planctomycetia bacterium]
MAATSTVDRPASGPPGSNVAGREGVILFTLAALQFISMVDFMIVMPLGPQLLADLGIDAKKFSWVVSAYTLAAGIAGLLAAPWLDRVPRKSAYLVLALGLLAGTAACGLAATYPLLLAVRCVTGAFGGVLGGLSLAIVADVFPPERRGRATGILMLAFGVASVAGVPLGIVLGTRLGWQAPFFALTALGLPLVGLAAWALPPLAAHVDGTHRHPVAHLLETLTVPAHRRAYALISLLMVAAFSVIPFISTALVANVGVTESQLPIVFIAGGLLTLVSTPLAGRLVDRFGALWVFRGVVPLSAALMLVLTHLPAAGIVVAAPATALLMATNSSRMVSATSLITSSIEPRRRGSFMSANSAVQHVASGFGATLGGMIVDGAAGEPLRNFGIVGMLAAAATVATLWLAARIRPLA